MKHKEEKKALDKGFITICMFCATQQNLTMLQLITMYNNNKIMNEIKKIAYIS